MAEQSDQTNISDLAKESKFKTGGGRWIPRIPLMILAPLLVLCALIVVVVPVEFRVQNTVHKLYSDVDAVVYSPEVAIGMTTSEYWSGSPVASKIRQ
ncbi:hypothetical protein HK104_001688 [Borealophlyctis nickersoniae]|nr:hypothetical protein HK104_001688 [Borealophlyctis nickersoniae]